MPGQELQLFVKGLNGDTTVIRVPEDATIAQLRSVVAKKTRLPDSEEGFRLLFTSKDLRAKDEWGKTQTMKDFKIVDQSNLFVVLRLPGGSEPAPKQLPDDVELTYEPDMISLEDCKDDLRAKMPCGHAIGPESLTAYCRSLLTVGKYEFRCPYATPYCGQLWDFYTVKHLAVLTENERKEFETKVAENYLRKGIRIQECPGCLSYCERRNKDNPRVICPVCTMKKSKQYEYCWFCLKTWLGSGTTDCGNFNCPKEDPRLKILRECKMKEVVEVPNCPSVRACPKCGILIEHIKACKQMTCPCGQKFCFICLKMADGSQYKCGAWNFKCEVAPIQKSLPK